MGQSKPFLELKPGWAIIQETISGLADCVDEVILACRKEDQQRLSDLLGERVIIVEGGSSRRESVEKALSVISEKAELVLIHDAARPLCTAEQHRAVIKAAGEAGAAILAYPAQETLKKETTASIQTVSRDGMWLAQTPQVFSVELLRRAYKQSLDATDDSQLVEALGHPIRLVPGSRRNIKVTYPEDLEIVRKLYG